MNPIVFNARLDEFLAEFSEDEQEQILQYALDHIVPKLKGRSDLNKRQAELALKDKSKRFKVCMGWRGPVYADTAEEVWKLLGERPFGETYTVYDQANSGVIADEFVPY